MFLFQKSFLKIPNFLDFRSKSSKIFKFLGILYSFDYCPSFLDICLSKILQKFISNYIPRLLKLQFRLTVCSCLYQFRIFGRFGTSKLEVSNAPCSVLWPSSSKTFLRPQSCLWERYVGEFIMVTQMFFRCRWQNFDLGDNFECCCPMPMWKNKGWTEMVKLVTNNVGPTSQSFQQRI